MIVRVRDRRKENDTIELMLIQPNNSYFFVYSCLQKQITTAYKIRKESYNSIYGRRERKVLDMVELCDIDSETHIEAMRSIFKYLNSTKK